MLNLMYQTLGQSYEPSRGVYLQKSQLHHQYRHELLLGESDIRNSFVKSITTMEICADPHWATCLVGCEHVLTFPMANSTYSNANQPFHHIHGNGGMVPRAGSLF